MYISQVVLLSLAVTSVLCTLESALTFTVPARKVTFIEGGGEGGGKGVGE